MSSVGLTLNAAALEHITAILAESALSPENPSMVRAEPEMEKLWNWHAAKEMKHKAVAFDVYRAVDGTEKMRKRALRQATWFLLVDIVGGTIHMLRRDGQMWSWKNWRECWQFLFAQDGILRRVWPAYREYFRDSFHPWERDTRHLLAVWRQGEGETLTAG